VANIQSISKDSEIIKKKLKETYFASKDKRLGMLQGVLGTL
jgi:hypothetical protein